MEIEIINSQTGAFLTFATTAEANRHLANHETAIVEHVDHNENGMYYMVNYDESPMFTLCDACNNPIDPSNSPIILGDPENEQNLPAPDVDCVYDGTFCSDSCFSNHYQH